MDTYDTFRKSSFLSLEAGLGIVRIEETIVESENVPLKASSCEVVREFGRKANRPFRKTVMA
jgi:hypothetical protein